MELICINGGAAESWVVLAGRSTTLDESTSVSYDAISRSLLASRLEAVLSITQTVAFNLRV